MKIFVDSANLRDIEDALKRGFPSGITTNPSIVSKEERRDFGDHIRDIITLLQRHERSLPLSVELFTTEPREMLRQAEQFVRDFGDYDNLVVKVPVGWDELEVIYQLRRQGIKVNCTCCMSYNQAIIAAHPEALRSPGPHGIPLLAHAQKGGDAAAAVVDYLRQLTAAG